jgi:endonuclease YncB( thermonuclease family)
MAIIEVQTVIVNLLETRMFVHNLLVLFLTLALILVTYTIIPMDYEASARCPNGYHKDESGECEKFVDNKGKPRCPNGYHRSPDGDCEKVNSNKSSDSKKLDSDNKKTSTVERKKVYGDNLRYSLDKCMGKADCFEGIITEVVDGDTLDVNNVRIRLSLVNTPEVNEGGYSDAKHFTETNCKVGTRAMVDEDDGQKGGSYGRMIGMVYCENMKNSLNEELLTSGNAELFAEYCDVSEFANADWTDC